VNHRPHRKAKHPHTACCPVCHDRLAAHPATVAETHPGELPHDYRDLPLFGARWAQAVREGA